jgi:hypothetical protein
VHESDVMTDVADARQGNTTAWDVRYA